MLLRLALHGGGVVVTGACALGVFRRHCRNPSWCDACRDADRSRARGEQPRHIDASLWRAPDTAPGRGSVSVEEINRHNRERAPQSTCDALLWELREYGLPQLTKPDCRRRLADLSTAQIRDLIAALIRLRPKYPIITNELIAKVGEQL